MHNDEVRDTLFTIFETGVFYNASILAYKEPVRAYSHLEDILSTWNEPNRVKVLESVSNHFVERCSDLRKDIFAPNEYYNQQSEINAVSHYINSYLNLPWPLFLLSRKNRETHSPQKLLSKYFEVYRLTNGFECFDSKRLREIISELHFLKEIRDKKLLIMGRTSLRIDKETGFIYIYFDENKTSFRQSLENSVAIYGDGDCLRNFKKPNEFSDIKKVGRLLIALDYSAQNAEFVLEKQKYFDELLSKYPVETEKGFADERPLYRAIRAFDKYLTAVEKFYQIDDLETVKNTDGEEQCRQRNSAINMRDLVDPSLFIKTALSTYINYFSYLIANKAFFQRLEKLKQMICKDLIEEPEVGQTGIELRAFFILNDINMDIKIEGYQSKFDESSTFRDKYKEDILTLREHPVPLDLWGYYFLDGFTPSISELNTVMNEINRICSNNLDKITRNDLKSLSVKFDLGKLIVIKKLLPIDYKGANAGYGIGNPAVIIPRESSKPPSDTIQSALNLFDRLALKIHLGDNLIADKRKSYELLLQGLYYFYEKEWKGKNTSEEKCIDIINNFYDVPIAKSKLRSGKANALKLIKTFVPNQPI